ncbi:MAG: SRPBCC domain-containing protein [Paracoccaceae bacterium]
MTDLTLSVSRVIKASPQRVFEAWLDPTMLARFMLAGPGMTVPEVKTDPKAGGRFSILMRMGDNDLPHGGTYLELVPHSRIVFSWESPYSIDGSTVTVALAPKGDGTMVTLTHVRFPSVESRDNHASGWTAILAQLATELE